MWVWMVQENRYADQFCIETDVLALGSTQAQAEALMRKQGTGSTGVEGNMWYSVYPMPVDEMLADVEYSAEYQNEGGGLKVLLFDKNFEPISEAPKNPFEV